MEIAILLLVAFTISFLLIFKMAYNDNKTQPDKNKLHVFGVLFVVFLLALIPTAVIAVFIFILLGSTNAVNLLFTLEISGRKMIVFAISLFMYYFTIDSVIEIIVKYIVGKNNAFYFGILLLIRLGALYIIGTIIGLPQTSSFVIATGLTVIILTIEVLYYLHKK